MRIPTIGGVNSFNSEANIASVNTTRNISNPSFGQISSRELAFLKKYMTAEDEVTLNKAMMDLGPKLLEHSKKASALRDGTMRNKIKEIKARNFAKQMGNIPNFISNLLHVFSKKTEKLPKISLLKGSTVVNPVNNLKIIV